MIVDSISTSASQNEKRSLSIYASMPEVSKAVAN